MRYCAGLLLLLLAVVLCAPALAAETSTTPVSAAETIRTELLAAQLALASDAAQAQAALSRAQAAYTAEFAQTIAAADPAIATRISEGFTTATQAVQNGDSLALAGARSQIWTGLLHASYTLVEQAVQRNDGATARTWLNLREFRHATRFSRPNADATLAVNNLATGSISPAVALQALRADLLDTYQARLNEALDAVLAADTQGFASQRVTAAVLAEGYFAILAPAYREQRGSPALTTIEQQFTALHAAAFQGQHVAEAVAPIKTVLTGFRAAPLSAAEQSRRAGQMLRFLSLVPVEYARGIRDGKVVTDLEIREAITFSSGAAAAFSDLRSLLEQRDPTQTAAAAQLFATLQQQLAAAGSQTQVADPAMVQATTDELVQLLATLMPAEWQQHNSSADFDVIQTALDQMEAAVQANQYDLAESARLEAYAILESGPEARLIVFAPQYKPLLEGLFWYGQDEHKGLAYLIEHRAPAAEIQASRVALNLALADAQEALAGNNAPVAVASNAAVIVFREGLEAVLILASLMGSLKFGEQRRLRIPLWWGAVAALAATVLTWLLARGALTALARYGERLEAIVSLVAVAVLLLIMNWFFHDLYWKGWMANFHQHKRRIIGGSVGQWLGLVVLGFTSIYREGFETVLFLQALVLESGTATVLGGVAVGLTATLLIGLCVFVLQAKLPHKKMLIATGILIGVVLLQMVGNTVHVMQVVGWLPTSPIRWLTAYLPYWAGMWFGLYATWEGIGLQALAGTFTIGSYFLAEYLHKRAQRSATLRQPELSGDARA